MCTTLTSGDSLKTQTQILESFLSADLEIVLTRPHLALLLLLRHRNLHTDREMHDFSESELLDLYEIIDGLQRYDTAGAQSRARGAVAALQKARVIIRSDCGGLSARQPFYSLTGLGRCIADQISETVDYDRLTLKSIIGQATVRLVEAERLAKDAKNPEEWRENITIPIREFLEGVFERILRYQASLDEQHQKVQDKICAVAASGNAAETIEPCMRLLDASIQNIRELYDVLLDSLNKTEEVALSIASYAMKNREREASLAADSILRRTVQIKEWAETRLDAWSLHYQNVLRFIEDVLRVDPERHISEALKTAIRKFDGKSPTLEFALQDRIVHLNETFLDKPEERPTRPKQDSRIAFAESEVERATARVASEIRERIESQLKSGGRVRLSNVLIEMEHTDLADLHQAVGIAFQKLLKDPRIIRPKDFQWTKVRQAAEIQDVEVADD